MRWAPAIGLLPWSRRMPIQEPTALSPVTGTAIKPTWMNDIRIVWHFLLSDGDHMENGSLCHDHDPSTKDLSIVNPVLQIEKNVVFGGVCSFLLSN